MAGIGIVQVGARALLVWVDNDLTPVFWDCAFSARGGSAGW